MWSCSVRKMFLKRGSNSVVLLWIFKILTLKNICKRLLLSTFLVFGLLLTVAISEKVWGLLFSLFLWCFVHAFFISNTFISNARLKLVESQANAKQHPEAELFLFEKYPHSSFTLSSKISKNILENKQKNKCLWKWKRKWKIDDIVAA